MYTSFDKINDRFGFNTGGTFRCAFKNTRAILMAGLFIIILLFVLIIVNLIYIGSMFDSVGSIGDFIDIGRLMDVTRYADISARQLADDDLSEEKIDEIQHGFEEMFSEEYLKEYFDKIEKQEAQEKAASESNYDPEKQHHLLEAFSEEMINMSVTFIATGFGMYALLISVIVFLITVAILRTGQTYKFKANDDTFTVIYPKRMDRTLTMEYDYITGVKYEEWHFPCSPRCLDVTVQTKQGDFTFRCIHTPMSRSNGIAELPFNIILEKIGLSKETDVYLLHKAEGRIR